MRLISAALLIALALGPSAPASAAPAFDLSKAEALLEAGRLDAALELLDRRIRKQPTDADALFLRSTAQVIAGDFAAARSDLERSLEIEPGRREGWLNRAALDIADESYQQAVEAFRRAEALDPTAQDNSLNIGAALLLAGDRDGASRRFQRYLKARADDPTAFYLVAVNYAMADRGDLAVPLLKRAVSLDERFRLRARRDANFAALAQDAGFQQILTTDTFEPAAGSHVAERSFAVPYAGRDDRVLQATLTSLQLAGSPLSRAVEVTPAWALIWSDVRIKVAANDSAGTTVIVSAPQEAFSPEAWSARIDDLFRQITLQLHSRRPSPAAEPQPRRP